MLPPSSASRWHQSSQGNLEDPVTSAAPPRHSSRDAQAQNRPSVLSTEYLGQAGSHDQAHVIGVQAISSSHSNPDPGEGSSELTSPPNLRVDKNLDRFSDPNTAISKNTSMPEPSRKRPRQSGPRMSYPRKRAVTACQVCRIRKSKCDNQRPVCGSCGQLDVDCIYQDQASDYSSFDPASLAILDRLNYSINLIEDQTQTLARAEFLTSFQSISQHSVEGTADASTLFPAAFQAGGSFQGLSDKSSGFEELPQNNFPTTAEGLDLTAKCSSDHVLEWPIFEGNFDPSYITAQFFDPDVPPQTRQTFEKNMHLDQSTSLDTISKFSRNVQQEDIAALIPDFLNNVHIKNPILDPVDLKSIAKRLSENGFGWDGPSCLILVACALANLSAPFEIVRPEEDDASHLDARDYSAAEAYYTAARKRIGLLGISVLATQCYFLLGVYEMYSLRPVQAWLSFNCACTTFQIYLQTQSHKAVYDQSSRRLEQRLYWSCLKSEFEMRDEVDLPPTGLAKIDFPDMLPSPPDVTQTPEGTDQHDQCSPLESMLERSWYYYLSEIALRQLANRITQAFHRRGPQTWLATPLKHLRRIADELDTQIVQWAENIPRHFEFHEHASSDELIFFLQTRYLELRERIWRPFLYLAIHQTSTEADQLTITACAQRSLDRALRLISQACIKHRHHGSWYGARTVFTESLLLLAAVKSRKLSLPSNWRSCIDLALKYLKYWESEAPDLKAARSTLVTILEELDGNPESS